MGRQPKTDGSLAMKEKKVIVIEAKEQQEPQKLRVAAYARVSSDSADQLNSYAAQTAYFTELITSNDKWKMVDIYADAGITGTSAEKRDDFQRMLADCRRGQIDRIITKSVSRFARNTRECLTAIRELKAIGVGIYFEEQNIDTSKVTGEMLTAVFAGLAQAESQSISQNVRWSYERRMASGEFNTCKYPFGFRLVDGKLEVYEPEAKIIRMIFSDYLSGMSCEAISDKVEAMGVKTRDGGDKWGSTTISYILANERYAGNALLQKKFTTETFPPQRKRNHGEMPQYYVADSNPAIITAEMFLAAGELLALRAPKHLNNRVTTSFSKMIRCGNCGSVAKRKVHKGKTYWVCYRHHRSAESCGIGQVPESEIKAAFLRLCYKLKGEAGTVLKELLSTLTELRDKRMLWSADVIELNIKISDIMDQDRQLNELNSLGLADPDFYIQEKNDLAKRLREVKLKKERLVSAKDDETLKHTRSLMEVIEGLPEAITDFDEDAFKMLVDEIIIKSQTEMVFRLKNGLELSEYIERSIR